MKRIILTLALLATLLAPQVAQAETVRCRWPWQPALIRLADGSRGWTCIYVPQGWQR